MPTTTRRPAPRASPRLLAQRTNATQKTADRPLPPTAFAVFPRDRRGVVPPAGCRTTRTTRPGGPRPRANQTCVSGEPPIRIAGGGRAPPRPGRQDSNLLRPRGTTRGMVDTRCPAQVRPSRRLSRRRAARGALGRSPYGRAEDHRGSDWV